MSILDKMKPGKVILILGARRVGKTILLKDMINKFDSPVLQLNGEDFNTHKILEYRSVENYKSLLGDKRILVIDEAQKIPDIGSVLKLMIDEINGLKIIATGSSVMDLQGKSGEPLTGRKFDFNLFALSEVEFTQKENMIERIDNLKSRLVFGNYPELLEVKNREDKIEYLKNIVTSYLLKDIMMYENIKNSGKIFDLLKLIAYQVGNQVSNQELGKQLSMHKDTVEKYLDLLSKVFVIHKLSGYSRNLRKEIVKTSKWYFLDNGIRNAIISNFNQLEMRNDIGQLWENYIISERLKYQNYSRMAVNNYFWRTYDRQEIDWVEEREGKLFAYEFKWKEDKVKIPVAFKKAYPDSDFTVINSENYFEWINYEK